MNNIDALIAQLCPDGVEFRELREIGKVCMCKRVMKHETTIAGDIPFFKIGTFGKEPDAYISKELYEDYRKRFSFPKEGEILISASGTIGRTVIYNGEPAYFQDSNIVWIKNDESKVTNKFLFYLYKTVEWKTDGGTIARLYNDNLSKTIIPIPPLPVQQEIVNILDKFTQFQAELQAELQARRAQYEYYRNELLNFEAKEVEWKPLGEVCDNIISGKNALKANEGDYPVYGSTGIIGRSNLYVYENDCLLVARVGANAGFVYKAKGKYDVSDNTLIIRPKEIYNMSFAYFQLLNLGLNKFAVGGGQPLITAGLLKKLKIPLPPLAEQNRIIAILDKFDKLVNDISEGLPAEIQARRKQYEYYRGRLLDFKALAQ